VVAILVSAGIAGSSRRSNPKGARPIESPAWREGLVAGDLGSERSRPAMAAIDAIDAAAEIAAPSAPAWLGSTNDPMVAPTGSARSDGGLAVPAARKAAALPARPAPRVAAKAPPPDDGREELYVPEAR
jgi:hypothetical protein